MSLCFFLPKGVTESSGSSNSSPNCSELTKKLVETDIIRVFQTTLIDHRHGTNLIKSPVKDEEH